MVDLTRGTFLHLPNANLIGTAGSVLILPTGFDTSAFHSFSTQGTIQQQPIHVAGTPFVIPAGQSVIASYVIADPVQVDGTLTGSATLTGGLTIAIVRDRL